MSQQPHLDVTACVDLAHIKMETSDDDLTGYGTNDNCADIEDAKDLIPGEITTYIKQEINLNEVCISNVGCSIKTEPSNATGQWEAVWINSAVSDSSTTFSKPECSGWSSEIKQKVDHLACARLDTSEIREAEHKEYKIRFGKYMLLKNESNSSVESYKSNNHFGTCTASYDRPEDKSASTDAKLGCIQDVNKCNLCDYRAQDRCDFLTHVEIKHNQVAKSYKCKDCNYTTTHESELANHITQTHNTNKDDMPKQIATKNANIYKCDKCEYSSGAKVNLATHVRYMHNPNAKMYKCEKCEYTTKYRCSLNKHMTHIHDPACEVYKCKDCNYITKYKRSLARHVNRKHDPLRQVYKCKECDYTTRLDDAFIKHTVRVHKGRLYTCNQCRFTHASRERYEKHMDITHCSSNGGYQCHASDGKFYKCDECNYMAADESYLKEHLKANALPDAQLFMCVQCNYATKIRRHLKFHIASVHGPPQDVYKCDSCDFESKHKGNLLLHTISSPKCAKNGFLVGQNEFV